MCAFKPNEQSNLLTSGKYDMVGTFRNSLNKSAPWESIVDFATHRSFCGFNCYPRQLTLLKVAFLETEHMTAYDLDVIEEWRQGFTRVRDVYGVQPDIWERINYLKERGYRRFPHIQFVLGRRASKGFLGGILGAEQLAYLHALDNFQSYYGIKEGKDVFLNVGATSMTQAQRNQFSDVRLAVENCTYLTDRNAIAENKPHQLRIRTPADLRRIAELKAAGVPMEGQIASLWAVPLSASSTAGRGATSCCLDPETPVLTADLRWVPIKSVMPGDEVVGVDEEPPGVKSDGRRLQRKLRKATVLGKTVTTKMAYRLRFTDGSDVVCSADHRWLTRSKSTGALIWRTTIGRSAFHSIKAGDQISRIVEPWEQDDSRDAGYLAGVYDGEGSLYSGSGLAVMFSQNPGQVLDETLAILKEKGFHPQPNNSHSYGADGKLCQQWAIRGLAEGLRFLGQIRPHRLLAKATDNYVGVAIRGKPSSRYEQPPHFAIVESVEELPEQELVDIQTTTATFIANGLVSHNCNIFDEFAFHVQGSGSVKSGEEIYEDWQPSLGQFRRRVMFRGREINVDDSLTYVPSSPATKVGKFFELYQHGRVLMAGSRDEDDMSEQATAELRRLAVDSDGPSELTAEPTYLIFQSSSWELYRDWERAHLLPGQGRRRVRFAKAPEPDLSDEAQNRRKLRNPEKFKVEREGQFAEVFGQYFDPDKVDLMFAPIPWRAEQLSQQLQGTYQYAYRIHGDPAKSGANFSLAIAHLENSPCDKCGWYDPVVANVAQHRCSDTASPGMIWPHVMVDYLHVWKAEDFPVNPDTGRSEIDYISVLDDIRHTLRMYGSTSKISFDQWNSVYFLQALRNEFAPRIQVSEVTFTAKSNYERAEEFKTILNLGWIHSHRDDFGDNPGESLLNLEMKFLSENNGKVEKQGSGPVQTKDLWDSVCVVATDLLHDQLDRYTSGRMLRGSFGSTDSIGLRSGREFSRLAEAGLGGQPISEARRRLTEQKITRSREKLYNPGRLSSIRTRGGR